LSGTAPDLDPVPRDSQTALILILSEQPQVIGA
jgi:hypothetical protein